MRNLIATLRRLDKTYYTIADLRKITRLSRDSLYVTLSRLVRQESLVRLTSGVYILAEKYSMIDVVANTMVQPSYLSFESALSRYGMLSQVPFTLTFATTRKSSRKRLGDVTVEYRTLKKKLFSGYEKSDSLFIATPEKALLDTVYFISFGKISLRLDQLDLKEVDTRKAKQVAAQYPEKTRSIIRRLLSIGA